MSRHQLLPEIAAVKLPPWAEWVAQDADGTWWVYEVEPNQQSTGWYENEVGRIQRLIRTAAPAEWETTLRRVGREAP